MVQVFFATNRTVDPTSPHGFGSGIVAYDRNAITYAVADVTVDTSGSGSGTVGAISQQSLGAFSDAVVNAIVGTGRNLLVFLHGFDNTFEDALTRAALNTEWYRASSEPLADTSVIAFCWPSLGQLIALGSPPDGAYIHDQQMATDSGYHLEYFLGEIDRVRQACEAQNPARRIFLLAHSMGNWVLQAGITRWYQSQQPADDIFDEVILAAADEQADTFAQPGGIRLGHLRDVARRINIYFSRNDLVLGLSTAINGNARLGYDGPTDRTNAALFPPSLFRMVDCTGVRDFGSLFDLLDTHQYYRLSPTVRSDIVKVMAKTATPAGGPTSLP